MKNHKVYLITNQVNGKKYIGKTGKSLVDRLKQHKKRAKNDNLKSYLLHRSMKKHGIDNFQIELIEAFNNQDEAYQAEAKNITEYNTFHGDGYNLTSGGTGMGCGENHPDSSLSNEDVSHIKWIIDNVDTTDKQIADYYHVGISAIEHIRRNSTWTDIKKQKPDFDIPDSLERKRLIGENGNNTKITNKQAGEIKWLVENTNMTYGQISSHYPVSKNIPKDIKHGKSWVHVESQKPKHLTKYQMKRVDKHKTISDQNASEIKWLATESDMTQEEIADMYSVSGTTVYDLKQERSRSCIKPVKPDFV
jgi:group I intron endonuclease